jgi:peroxiredoxin
MRWQKIHLIGIVILAAASAVFFSSRQHALPQDASHGNGAVPPDFEATSHQALPPSYQLVNVNRQDVPDGELSRGRVLVVYMTTSCEPCVEEAKIISRFVETAPADLRVYGVSFDRESQVTNFIEEFAPKFPVLIDTGARLAKSLDLRYFPSTFLIEEGVITKKWTGVTRDEASFYRQVTAR